MTRALLIMGSISTCTVAESRAMGNSELVARLLGEAVPEVAAGIVLIKAAARRENVRCKLALASLAPLLDCVGACVGDQGTRIKVVIDALGGERVDLVRWSESPAEFIANALQPARVVRVLLDSAEHHSVVWVPPDQVTLAHGRLDENRRLAEELTGWTIQIQES